MHTCMHTHSPSALTLSAICAIQRCDPENPAVFIPLQLNSTFAVCTNMGSASCKHLKIHTVGKRQRFCLFLPSIAIKAAYRRWDKQKYLYMCTEKTQDNFTLNTFFIFFFLFAMYHLLFQVLCHQMARPQFSQQSAVLPSMTFSRSAKDPFRTNL